jgi:hypothetical protein
MSDMSRSSRLSDTWTLWTPTVASTPVVLRLGAERSQVQVLSPPIGRKPALDAGCLRGERRRFAESSRGTASRIASACRELTGLPLGETTPTVAPSLGSAATQLLAPARFQGPMPLPRASALRGTLTRPLWALLVVSILFGAIAGAASASTWTVTTAPHGSVRSALYGISCPSPALCVAVGGNNTVAASTNPTGGARAWNVSHPGGAFEPPPGTSGEVTFGGGQIRGVSCPSSSLCVASSLDGHILSATDPSGNASAWKIVPLSEGGPNFHLFGISCPSASLCVAVGYGGKVITSTDPTGDRSAWTVTGLSQPFDLRGVSCPSVSLCVAVGNEGSILTSTDPTGGPSAWQSAGAPAGEQSLNAMSCPSASLCITGNSTQVIYSINPAGGPWKVLAAGAGLLLEGFSCASPSACAAVDDNADVIVSTDPTGGQASWSFKNVIPMEGTEQGNGMFAISCPTTSLCAAAGQNDQLITSTDPFAPDALPSSGRRGRPRVVITGHPAQRLNPHRGGVKVTFRFHAIGRASGFRCRMNGHPFNSCRSPVRYRVGRGKHVFRVRAIGQGEIKGPPASFHFRVGHLRQRSPVGSCPPGSTGGNIHHPCIEAR